MTVFAEWFTCGNDFTVDLLGSLRAFLHSWYILHFTVCLHPSIHPVRQTPLSALQTVAYDNSEICSHISGEVRLWRAWASRAYVWLVLCWDSQGTLRKWVQGVLFHDSPLFWIWRSPILFSCVLDFFYFFFPPHEIYFYLIFKETLYADICETFSLYLLSSIFLSLFFLIVCHSFAFTPLSSGVMCVFVQQKEPSSDASSPSSPRFAPPSKRTRRQTASEPSSSDTSPSPQTKGQRVSWGIPTYCTRSALGLVFFTHVNLIKTELVKIDILWLWLWNQSCIVTCHVLVLCD